MRTIKEMKKSARKSVKEHYWILFMVCLIAACLGAEFSDSLQFVEGESMTESEEEDEDELNLTDHAIIEAVRGNITQGRELSDKILKQKKENDNTILGRRRGVLASIINGIDSGSILIMIVSASYQIGMSKNIVMAGFVILALGFSFALWFFFENVYRAVVRRIFLEARTYEKVGIQRLLFLFRVKKWTKACVTMFMAALFKFLWSFTIIGGFVKRYSYYLVPYIVAENPDIKWNDAILLSRNMMDGHKWQCFLYEMSFLPWYIASVFTLGISDIVFANQYKVATFTEYYSDIRLLAKEKNIKHSEWLNDTYLYEKATHETLQEAYQKSIERNTKEVQKGEEKFVPATGIREMLADVFGITIFPREDEEQYQRTQISKMKLEIIKDIIAGLQYPEKLYSISGEKRSIKMKESYYLRSYSIPSIILLFFSFAIIGWCWEVSLHLAQDGIFVNRGALHGPWLPIYGFGGVFILMILNKLRKKPMIEFVAIIILCGFIEYSSACYMEKAYDGQKWWDYSGYFLNLNGKICAEGLLIFGLGGMGIVYFAAPLLDNYFRTLPYRYAIPICLVLICCFSVDNAYSIKHPNAGRGITDYTSMYEKEEEHVSQRYAKLEWNLQDDDFPYDALSCHIAASKSNTI